MWILKNKDKLVYIYYLDYLKVEKLKLQSQISRKYKNKSYKKFWIIIPKKILEKLCWKSGQELESNIKNNKLIIEKDE